MKTFLVSIPDRLKSFNEKLDIKGILCGKSWEVFNDDGLTQLFIFKNDGTLLITTNGKVINSHWLYAPENKSIIITAEDDTTMFMPAFYDNVIFALKQQGIEKYLFMIDEKNASIFPERTLQALNSYFEEKEKKAIEQARLNDPVYISKMEEEQKVKERKGVLNYLKNRKDGFFNGYIVGTIIKSAIGILFLAIGLLFFFLYDIFVVGVCLVLFGVLCFLAAYTPKTEYIKKKYESDTKEEIKFLTNKDIKEIIKNL